MKIHAAQKMRCHLASVFVYIVAVLLIGGCLDMIFLDPSVYLSPVLAVCFLSSIGAFSFSVCNQPLSFPNWVTDLSSVFSKLTSCWQRISFLPTGS